MATTCRYGDPTCPCNDGDVCNYEDVAGSRGLPRVLAGPAAGEPTERLRRAMLATRRPEVVELEGAAHLEE